MKRVVELNEQNKKWVKYISLSLNILFILFLIAGFVLSTLAIINYDNSKGKSFSKPLLTVGVILALYPMTRMMFKNLSLHIPNEKSKVVFAIGYRVAIKTHLYASLAAIFILLGHAVFWIYQCSNGGYPEVKHGIVKYKAAGFGFGEIIGIIALSMMVYLAGSSLILKYNYSKPWIKPYRIFHIVLAITSAILIIIHISTV